VDVLYLHPASAYGGSSKSLIELYQILRKHDVRATVLTPAGSAAAAFADAGMSTITIRGLSQFDNTRYGHYRGVRWLILVRELAYLPISLLAIWCLRRHRFDVLHVNEVTLLPVALFAKKLLGLPMVVHVRSLQCEPTYSRRSKLFSYWLKQHADAVIAIDRTVAQTLDSELRVNIVHNGLGKVYSGHNKKMPRPEGQPLRVGFMGVLIALKGVYELVDAMRILKGRGVDIECVIAGENAREVHGVRAWALRKLGFARDVRSELKRLIHRHGLERQVHLLGFVKDIHALYPTLDILCFPSYLNAAGRPVFEAALFGVPSVVAIDDPPLDAVLHGETGLAIPRPNPELIADALQSLAQNHEFRLALGCRAQAWALELFSIENSAAAVLRIYRQFKQRSEHKKQECAY
jgi:glycosyltransferase involved in cell wall biosynthesis